MEVKTVCQQGRDPEEITKIIQTSFDFASTKRGGNNTCVIVSVDGQKYAVLKSSNIELYSRKNPRAQNNHLSKEEIINSGEINLKHVMELTTKHQEHNAVPIIGISYGTEGYGDYGDAAYGRGYIVQPIAMGEELFGSKNSFSDTPEDIAKLLVYAEKYSKIPAEHFADFYKNYVAISQDIMVDPSKRGNFFYHPEKGFSFIDLNFFARESSIEELQHQALMYIQMQFRTIYSGTFAELPEEVKAEYSKNTVSLYCSMLQGFREAGATDEMIAAAMGERLQDDATLGYQGVKGLDDLLAMITRVQDEGASKDAEGQTPEKTAASDEKPSKTEDISQ